jgi:hypothetical protein
MRKVQRGRRTVQLQKTTRDAKQLWLFDADWRSLAAWRLRVRLLMEWEDATPECSRGIQ